jgi:hypothetical protein
MCQSLKVFITITNNENKHFANKKFKINSGELNKHKNKFIRNIIIYSLYIQKISEGELGKMDIYVSIETYLKENFDVVYDADTIRGVLWKINTNK